MDRVDLLNEANELADLILRTPEIEMYRAADAALKQNGTALHLLRRFRELREQVAEFQARRVPPMHYAYLLEETDQLLKELQAIPEIVAFEDAQEKLNTLLDAVTARLSSSVKERLDKKN